MHIVDKCWEVTHRMLPFVVFRPKVHPMLKTVFYYENPRKNTVQLRFMGVSYGTPLGPICDLLLEHQLILDPKVVLIDDFSRLCVTIIGDESIVPIARPGLLKKIKMHLGIDDTGRFRRWWPDACHVVNTKHIPGEQVRLFYHTGGYPKHKFYYIGSYRRNGTRNTMAYLLALNNGLVRYVSRRDLVGGGINGQLFEQRWQAFLTEQWESGNENRKSGGPVRTV